MTDTIHQALLDKQLPPAEHLVDSAYVDAELLLHSRDQAGIRLCGPTRKNSSWQTKVQGAYDIDQFEIDWEQQVVRCPQGKASRSWKETTDQTGAPLIYITFSRTDCLACEARPLCTKGQKRVLGFRPREQYEALQEARQRHASEEGQQLYRRRAGIEGTISQAVRAFGLRRTRYRGLARTHLQHVATAAAINLDRLFVWGTQQPRAKTRKSRFAKLAA
jgi:transposase